MPAVYSVNLTMSLGVHSRILHSFSRVTNVTFLFFFSVSSVLLSMPLLRSWYWVISLFCIVSHNGLKSIISVTTLYPVNLSDSAQSIALSFNYRVSDFKIILWRYAQYAIMVARKNETVQDGMVMVECTFYCTPALTDIQPRTHFFSVSRCYVQRIVICCGWSG